MRSTRTTLAAIFLTITVTGCGNSPGLQAADPSGAAACTQLAAWLEGKTVNPLTGQPYDATTIRTVLTEPAGRATTPGIKSASGDPRKLYTACTDAGVQMPAYAEPTGAK